jgi:molybdopterin synthase catalytic subunit
MNVHISLHTEPIHADTAHQFLSDSGSGAEVLFIGAVRDANQGRTVKALEFEAYPRMVVTEMERIASELNAQWPIHKMVLLHRLGTCAPGEVVVVAGVSSKHRQAAFEACEALMDAFKKRIPIWKKEIFEDGEVWVSAHP